MIRALIVDDEEHARRGIASRLARLADVEVAGMCANGRDAIESVHLLSPALMFLDIQMPGKDGFEVLREIGAASCPLVIFVTAYDRYAMRAFEVHALDYLLKPLDDERFNAAIDHAREMLAQRDDAQFKQRLTALLAAANRPADPAAADAPPDRLLVRTGSRIIFVRIADIDWIGASGDYVTLHAGGKFWLMRDTITAVERQVAPHGFARIHRSTLVNRDCVAELRYHDNGDYRVLLRDGTTLKLSRNYHAALQRLLKPRFE